MQTFYQRYRFMYIYCELWWSLLPFPFHYNCEGEHPYVYYIHVTDIMHHLHLPLWFSLSLALRWYLTRQSFRYCSFKHHFVFGSRVMVLQKSIVKNRHFETLLGHPKFGETPGDQGHKHFNIQKMVTFGRTWMFIIWLFVFWNCVVRQKKQFLLHLFIGKLSQLVLHGFSTGNFNGAIMCSVKLSTMQTPWRGHRFELEM